MHLTMVKKRLENGEPCRKCVQAEELLRRRGLWERIDEVVWAEEGKPDSPGLKLAEQHDIQLAPFFIARGADGSERTWTSVMRFVKEALTPMASAAQTRGSPDALDDPERAGAELARAEPEEILRWGLERFGADCAIAFSGAEDVALVDMAVKLELPFSVFCLDTGRLHPETLEFIDWVRVHYGIEIRAMSPDPAQLEPFVRKKGLFSFYEDGHGECCGIRKVEPLKRALGDYRAWVTGQRIDQSPATRGDIAVVALDDTHRGSEREGNAGRLVKLNPLTHWSSERVWQYIRDNDVPFNGLHRRGFRSIGCAPCTRATLPGEHERAGRWWWEDATKRECGLHIRK